MHEVTPDCFYWVTSNERIIRRLNEDSTVGKRFFPNGIFGLVDNDALSK
ncbi:hypothetical protein AK973_2729 [Pseudomonas brassicacearum]|nr:hypothetical protein AK973_2729 [Pseudomonas brassicacearum]